MVRRKIGIPSFCISYHGMCSKSEKYRSIILTSCLGQFVERLIDARLYYFLEKNNLISNKQSVFRTNRDAADILCFFTRKISETLIKSNGIFFEISKAFDKVWHKCLIYKLIKINIPSDILKYSIYFLSVRKLKVGIGDTLRESGHILRSVPQGSVL